MLRVCVAIALACVLLSCSGTDSGMRSGMEELRAHTYPPDFNYISQTQLESTMWQLADLISKLDETLGSTAASDAERRARAVRLLSDMEQASLALGPGDWPSNHPRVSRNVEQFREEIRKARRDLALDPPSEFRAGSVSGACLHCHQAR
jgi:hypothetical protein